MQSLHELNLIMPGTYPRSGQTHIKNITENDAKL